MPLTFAFQPLLQYTKQHGTTVVTEGARSSVGLNREEMRADGVIVLLLGIG